MTGHIDSQVLFLAMGYPYVVMAINAAQSLRKTGTEAHIKLVTNCPIRRIRMRDVDVFDQIEVLDCETESNRWVKTTIIDRAEGTQNVLLDCDVEALAPLNPIMGLLRNFDVVARNLPFETRKKFILSDGGKSEQLSLSEINTGVIFFSKSAGARELFEAWHRHFLQMGESRDQPAFLRALIEARTTRFFALPPMWNATPFAYVDRREMKREPGAIRILHYRDPTFWPSVAKRLAEVHETATVDLAQPSSDFSAQVAAYSHIARQYRSALFPFAVGRVFLAQMLRLSTAGATKQLRVVGKRRTPGSSS